MPICKERVAITLLSMTLFLSGCATTPSTPAYLPPAVKMMTPEIGAIATKEVGEALFYAEFARRYKAIRFEKGKRIAIKNPLGKVAITMLTDGDYIFQKSTATGERYCGTAIQVGGLFAGDLPVSQQRPLPMCFDTDAMDREGTIYERAEVTRTEGGNFRQELLYQGKVGNEIRISYREFSGDLLRPGFTQDLSFDTAAGAMIGVRGARLEVLEATNTYIKYRMVRPFTE